MKKIFLTLCLCMLLYRPVITTDPIAPIRVFIQRNFIGVPVVYQKQSWIFDPDISLRRRRQFIELNGDKAEKLIERLGLGIDGYGEERLKKQRQRDEGHLGGLNYFLP